MPSLPMLPVRALMATSETPNRIPAAAPMSTPWCSCEGPNLGESTSRQPTASSPASKAIMPPTE